MHNNPLWLPKIDIRTVMYAICSRRYQKIIGVSNAILNEYRYSKVIKNKFEVLHNCINKEKIIKLANEYLEEKYDIIFVGRMTEPKNPLRCSKNFKGTAY